jgi:hypothetical protein
MRFSIFPRRFSGKLLVFAALFPMYSAQAAISSGADGFFRPVSDVTLTLPFDGVFNYTGIQIDEGIHVMFAGAGPNVTWLALNDIVINGTVLAPGLSMYFETAGSFSMNANGRLDAQNISISSTQVSVGGTLAVGGSNSGSTSGTLCPRNPGGGTLSVPGAGSEPISGACSVVALPRDSGTLVGGSGVITLAPVPLPAPLPLLATGLACLVTLSGLIGIRRRRPAK